MAAITISSDFGAPQNKSLLPLQLIDYITLGNFPQLLPSPSPKKKGRLGSPSLVQRKITLKENAQGKDT